MIIIRRLKVASLSKDFLDIVWEIEDTEDNVLDFDFFVQRSEGQEGPFEIIGGPLVDDFRFKDIRAAQFHRQRQFIYRIQVVNRLTGEEAFSDTALPLATPDLISREIQKLELVMLREFTGRRVWAFPKRTFGQKCGNCFDELKNRVKTGSCFECFGTGYVRGFLTPIETFMQIEPSSGLASQAETITERGKEQHNIVVARAFIIPILKAGDMIIESENARWRVTGSMTFQRLRHPVAQQVTLLEIPETDIEQEIPLRGIDLVTFESAPPRAFTNPQNIDAVRAGRMRTQI